jgi:hypothetical protein
MVLLEKARSIPLKSNIKHLQRAHCEAFTASGADLQAFSREALQSSGLKVLLTFIPTLKGLIIKDETRAFGPFSETFPTLKRYERFPVLRGLAGNEKSRF